MNYFLIVILSLIIVGCSVSEDSHKAYLIKKNVPLSADNQFSHCRAYGCKEIDRVALSKKQWHKIERTFHPHAKTAEIERKQIAKAIAVFEQEVGKLTGTKVDHYGTFKKLGTHQQDCVDESVNTTIYLDLLMQRGLLKFHSVQSPEARFPLIHAGRWPHQSAVITELENAKSYAVDSWFHDNGYDAEVIPLSEWKRGWKPETHKQNPSQNSTAE